MPKVKKGETARPRSGSSNQEFQPIPDGAVYEAEIVKVEQKVRDMWIDGEKQSRDRFFFTFEILDPGDFQGRRLKQDTPTTYVDNENCTLWNWTRQILGSNPDILDTDDLVDKRCRIEVGASEPKPRRDGNGTYVWNSVKTVFAPRESSVEPPF